MVELGLEFTIFASVQNNLPNLEKICKKIDSLIIKNTSSSGSRGTKYSMNQIRKMERIALKQFQFQDLKPLLVFLAWDRTYSRNYF